MNSLNRSIARITLFSALAGAMPMLAQLPMEGPVETRALISVESKQEATLDPKMIKIEVNGRATPLIALQRVQPSTAQIAILIDDGLRSTFGNQISDVKKFITSLPPGAQVLVGYMRNGTVISKGFTTDHTLAASGVRLPIASAGVSASPYFCLSSFVKNWPGRPGGARFVLMLTNGVDPYNGSTSLMNQNSPYVQSAMADAQRAGAAVYAIAFGDAGMRGGQAAFSGQSYLQQVADGTGGRSFYQGTIGLVSMAPYLKQFNSAIAESYNATFMVSSNREKGNTLTRVKISTSQPQVKVHAPDAVHPGMQ